MKKRVANMKHNDIIESEVANMKHTEGNKMTAAEKRAIKAREQELINEGVEKEIAEVMAKVEFEYGFINVVVNGN